MYVITIAEAFPFHPLASWFNFPSWIMDATTRQNIFRCFSKGIPPPHTGYTLYLEGGANLRNHKSRRFYLLRFFVAEWVFFSEERGVCVLHIPILPNGLNRRGSGRGRGDLMIQTKNFNSYAIDGPSVPLYCHNAMKISQKKRLWDASSTHGWKHSLAVSHRKDVTLCRIISPIGFLGAAWPGSLYEQSCDRARGPDGHCTHSATIEGAPPYIIRRRERKKKNLKKISCLPVLT